MMRRDEIAALERQVFSPDERHDNKSYWRRQCKRLLEHIAEISPTSDEVQKVGLSGDK